MSGIGSKLQRHVAVDWIPGSADSCTLLKVAILAPSVTQVRLKDIDTMGIQVKVVHGTVYDKKALLEAGAGCCDAVVLGTSSPPEEVCPPVSNYSAPQVGPAGAAGNDEGRSPAGKRTRIPLRWPGCLVLRCLWYPFLVGTSWHPTVMYHAIPSHTLDVEACPSGKGLPSTIHQ